MKAWQGSAWGEPESMIFSEIELPRPPEGQVRIAVRASGLNFFDILQVQGKYQVKPPFPFTPGAEAAGVVDAVGEGQPNCLTDNLLHPIPEGSRFAQHT